MVGDAGIARECMAFTVGDAGIARECMAFTVGAVGTARRTAITVGVGRVSMAGRVIGAAGGDAKLSGYPRLR
jgi:hypothetical protein